MTEQIIIFFQIVVIDLVLAGDNAIIIGMVASQFKDEKRKKIILKDILQVEITIIITFIFLIMIKTDCFQIFIKF